MIVFVSVNVNLVFWVRMVKQVIATRPTMRESEPEASIGDVTRPTIILQSLLRRRKYNMLHMTSHIPAVIIICVPNGICGKSMNSSRYVTVLYRNHCLFFSKTLHKPP